MSPLVWDLAHIGHYEELWLLRELGAADPTDPRFDDIYDAFRHPRVGAPDARHPRPVRGARLPRRRAQACRSTSSPAVALDADDPLLADGFVYGIVIHHEHQHDETMLATVQLMDGFAHPDAGDGPGASGAGAADLPLDVLVEAGPFAMGTSTDPWAYDNERPEHVVERPGVPHRHDAGDQRRVRRVRRGRRVRRPAVVDGRRLGLAHRGRARAPAVLDPRADGGWIAASVRPDRAAPRTRAGAARLLVRGGRVRALARRAPARPKPSGRRPRSVRRTPAGCTDRAGGSVPTRWVRTRPVRAPSGCLDMLGGVWEWTASDFEAYPGFRSFPYREYSEVFFGPGARSTDRATRCCAAGRGRPTRSRAASRSATGTSRSAARSSPASAARPTPEPRPCAATSRTSVPRSRSGRCSSTRRTRSCARRARRDTNTRAATTPTVGAWPGGTEGDAAGGHQRYRAATPMWDGPELRRRRSARPSCSPRRGTRRRAPSCRRQQRRSVRRRRLAVLAERVRRRLPRRVRRRAAVDGQPADASRRSRATPTARWCSRWCSTGSTPAPPRARRSPRSRGSCGPRARGALNLLLTDGTAIAATAIDNSLFLRTAPGLLVASEPLDDDGSWTEVDNGSLVENDRVTPIGGLP